MDTLTTVTHIANGKLPWTCPERFVQRATTIEWTRLKPKFLATGRSTATASVSSTAISRMILVNCRQLLLNWKRQPTSCTKNGNNTLPSSTASSTAKHPIKRFPLRSELGMPIQNIHQSTKSSAHLGYKFTTWNAMLLPTRDISVLVWKGHCLRTVHPCIPLQLLVEFLEMNMILGAEFFTVYLNDPRPQILATLQHYVDKGIVELVD